MKNTILTSLAFLIVFSFACKRVKDARSMQAVGIASHPPDTMVYGDLHLPDSLLKAGYVDSALLHYDVAVEKYIEIKDPEGYLRAVNGAAWATISLGDYEAAIQRLRNMEYMVAGRSRELARYYYNVATAYKFAGDPDSSEIFYRKAIEGYGHFPSESIKKAECLLGLGGIYCFTYKDYGNAQVYFEKALNEIHELDNSPEHLDIKYRCYYNLSVNNRWRKNYDKAEYYAKGVLDIARLMDQPYYLRYAHNMLGSIYESRGDLKKAVDHFKLSIENASSPATPSDYRYLVQAYNNLGFTYGKDSLYREAISAFEKALELEDEYNLQLTDDKSEIFAYLGRNYHRINQEDRAREYFNKAESMLTEDENDHTSKNSVVYYELANYYQDLEKFDRAIDYYTTSLNFLARKSAAQGFSDVLSTTHLQLNGLAKAYQKKGLQATPFDSASVRLALRNYLLADSLLQYHRTDDLLESDELYLNNHSQEYYCEALSCVRLLYDPERPDETLVNDALRLIEQNKAGILAKSLNKARSLEALGVPDSLIQRLKDIRQQIVFWQSQEKSEDSLYNKNVQKRLLSLIQQEELINYKINEEYPTRSAVGPGKSHLSIDTLQRLAKTDSSLILTYYVGTDVITSLVITPMQTFLFFVPVNSSLLESLSTYQRLVSGGNPVSEREYQMFIEASYFLYQQLVKPALDNRKSSFKNLFIIPDQVLSTVPFESLITYLPDTSARDVNYKSLPYLFRKYDLSYHYSLSLMVADGAKGSYGEGSPTFGGWGYENSDVAKEASLPSLLFAKKELEEVSDHFRSDIYFDKAATETQFKNSAEKYDILHLSLHGSFSSESGQACLYFNNDRKNDGTVYPFELYNLKLKAKLAVLSACETGLGNIEPGEGIFSIARGFFHSGCPSLVMNLWKVSDKSGVEIQSRFYENLSRGNTFSAALSQAKLSFLEKSDRYSSHPSFWASPILMGSNNRFMNTHSETGYVQAFTFLSVVALTAIAGLVMVLFTRRYSKEFDIKPRGLS